MTEKSQFEEEDFFYNHGDNPAYKRLVQISKNTFDKSGSAIDTRTKIVQKANRLLNNRNMEDFLQRDLKCFTFPRTLAAFFSSTLIMSYCTSVFTGLIPLGNRGYIKISQTPFYQSFGKVGVGLAGVGYLVILKLYIETLRFTVNKFNHEVIKGNKNYQFLEQNKGFRLRFNYLFKDTPLSHDQGSTPEMQKVMRGEHEYKMQGTITSPYQSLSQQ